MGCIAETVSNPGELAEAFARAKSADRTSVIVMMLHRVSGDAVTGFLRRQLEEGPEDQRGRYASILLSHLLTQEWSKAFESEVFDLLYIIEPANRQIAKIGRDPYLMFRAGVLMTINDWVLRSGYSVLYGAVEKKEDLSRVELREVQREKRHAIRALLAARLARELDEREGLTEDFSHWLNIERLYFDIAAKRSRTRINSRSTFSVTSRSTRPMSTNS